MYEYKAKLIRVIDGDTVDFDIDLGFDSHLYARVRLLGINTPETYGVKKATEEYVTGMQAKNFVVDFLSGKEILIKTEKDKTGKYGRYLATVYVDGVSLNQKLLDEGLAEEY